MTVPQHILTFLLLCMVPLWFISCSEIWSLHFMREDRVRGYRRRYRKEVE